MRTNKKTGMPEIEWPEVFVNPDFEYGTDMESKGLACSDGLTGWFICNGTIGSRKRRKPKCFGIGMGKIGKLLGVEPVHLELLKWARTTQPTGGIGVGNYMEFRNENPK